jgi:coenzyme F420-reducing hydrogenase beta subunit/acetyltransferase-like isoleucine patch superfamily enzyme
MISITDKTKCCGCNACSDICGHNVITFVTDVEGFWYPEVEKEKCTDCRLCEKVCPIINIKDLKKNDFDEPKCYAAIHKNLEIRFDSTSGGLFSALAEKMYRDGGYVGGVIYNEDFSASHFISNDKNDLSKLRSSKYLQSNAEGFYSKIKSLLTKNEKVLVCGTPCQMAALRAFLSKDYENLIILDFICMGVASPKAHRKYFDFLETKFGSKVVYFKAKNKELGWRNLTKKSIFANGKSFYGIKGQDLYSRAYHSHGINRPSCYQCVFKGFPRIADISLGDYWGVEKVAKELDDDIGTSAVIINSKKGENFFESTKNKLKTKETIIDSMLKGNPALTKPVSNPKYNRDALFVDLDILGFDKIADKYFPVPKESLKQKIKRYKKYLSCLISVTHLKPKPLWQFFKLNFFIRSIKTDWKKGHLIYPSPYCVFQIDKGASLILNAPIRFGLKKFKKSKLESRLLIEKGGKMVVNGDIRFGYGCDIEVFKNAELIFGGGGGNIGLTLICGEKIHVGANTYYGRDVNIRDTNGGHTIAQQGFKETNPVVIGDNVWLCSNCSLMPGVKVGDGAIVGAHSLIVSSIPPRSLVSGNPAKILDDNIVWKH